MQRSIVNEAAAGVEGPPWNHRGDLLREQLAYTLEASRARLWSLVQALPEAELFRQHSPLMSPIAWDLAHVVSYEEQWLLGATGAGRLTDAETDALYDAFRNPRAGRAELPLPSVNELRAWGARVRGQVLAQLSRLSLGPEEPLLHRGFVFGMVAQHEHQHAETVLATLQLMTSHGYFPPERARPPGRTLRRSEVVVPGGPFVMGTEDDPWAYDNERPAHAVDLPAFAIDAHPVTNGAFVGFIEDGGYRRKELWDPAGWALVEQEQWSAPLFWFRGESGVWYRRRFGLAEKVHPEEPVQHVSFYEADAYARWAGKRLPTEAEWEKAASWHPTQGKRRYPWGDGWPTAQHANLWQGFWAPAQVGAFPAGASAWGVEQLLGDVWEWTSSDFAPYPGFRAFPYREYSEVFFDGQYKVLRGGAWATHPVAIRATFRNWDFPRRRQIFAGFRCARDV